MRKDENAPCKADVNSDAPYVMGRPPGPVSSRFPALGDNQKIYAIALLPRLSRYQESTGGDSAGFRESLSESRADFWNRRCALCPQWFDMGRSRRPSSPIEQTETYESAPGFWPAPPYEPGRYFWARQYLGYFGRRRGPLEEEIRTVFFGRVLRVDFTGAAARRMRNAGGEMGG